MPDNAAVYLADPSLLSSRVFDTLEAVRSYEGLADGGRATGVEFVLDAGTVTMNFMPEQEIEEHLQGFAGFAEHVVQDKEHLPYVLGRIHQVRLVCGCVISPGFDAGGEIEAFLFAFCSATKGLLFYADTVFDHDGRPLGSLE